MRRVDPRTHTPVPATILIFVMGVILMVALPGAAPLEPITTAWHPPVSGPSSCRRLITTTGGRIVLMAKGRSAVPRPRDSGMICGQGGEVAA